MEKMDYTKIPNQPSDGQWLIRLVLVGFWVLMGAVAFLFLTIGAGIYAGMFWRALRWTLAQ